MKKILFLMMAINSLTVLGQVGIGTTTPDGSALLDIVSTSKGLLPPRLTTAQRNAIVNPAKGLIIYNTSLGCLQTNDGTTTSPLWNCVSGSTVTSPSTNGTAIVTSYGGPGCTGSGTINGSMSPGVAVSGVSMTLYANVTQLETWSLSATQNGVTFTGSGTFTELGCQAITLTASGIPTDSGTFTWNTNTTPIASAAATVGFNPISITPGTGNLSGRTCFDIALSNDNTNSCTSLTARTPTQADFTNPATHTQTYTFTPSGTVSNVRFYYINDVGTAVIAISGGNAGNNISTAVTATVNYNTNNNTLALGLTNSNAMTTRIFAVYNINATNNNNPADDRILALTANVKDCACCSVKVSATEWKAFLCHNLGANTSLDPHDMSQANAWGLNGAYIQWGRRGPNTTGDSRVDWQTAASNGPLGFAAAPTGSTAATANSGFISGWFTITPPADNSWRTIGGAKTANDPCPAGWRVPTSAEWTGVNSNNTVSRSGGWTNSATNYNSALHYGPNASTKLLTLPAAGNRDSTYGALTIRGTYGIYWSSTESSTGALRLYFDGGTVLPPAFITSRTHGFSLRCIAE
jgi:uncharacterized protein (TIGR02145 family)